MPIGRVVTLLIGLCAKLCTQLDMCCFNVYLYIKYREMDVRWRKFVGEVVI